MRSGRLRRFIVGGKQGAQSAHAKDLLLYGQSRRLTGSSARQFAGEGRLLVPARVNDVERHPLLADSRRFLRNVTERAEAARTDVGAPFKRQQAKGRSNDRSTETRPSIRNRAETGVIRSIRHFCHGSSKGAEIDG